MLRSNDLIYNAYRISGFIGGPKIWRIALKNAVGVILIWRLKSFKFIWRLRVKMDTHVVTSSVRGFHVYADVWTPSVGEILICERESGNPSDLYAVAIKKGSEVVGHVPRKMSAACCDLEEHCIAK